VNLVAVRAEHPRILHASLLPKLRAHFSQAVTKSRVFFPP
jgi:hypothetical protein